MNEISLIVAIPTFHRPTQLSRLLTALHPLVIDPRLSALAVTTRVLIIDNDPECGARTIVSECGDYVDYVSEPTPGLSAVRNRALAEATSDRLLAFIDDDEVPGPEWLTGLVSLWLTTLPAAISGHVQPKFSFPPDEWLIASRAFFRREYDTGERLEAAATNNLLLDLKFVRKHELTFDPSLGLIGGEDTLFTRQLVNAGGNILWCGKAIVFDYIPPDRQSRKWVLARDLSSGTKTAAVELRSAVSTLHRFSTRIRLLAGGVGRILTGTIRALFALLTRSASRRAPAERAIFRGLGVTAGAFGYARREYASHPSRSS